MNVLKKLTFKNLKLNRKRTVVTTVGIILSVMLVSAVVTMFFSFIESLIREKKREDGDFHATFYDVESSKLGEIKNNTGVEDVYLTSSLGFAKLEGNENNEKPYAHVYGVSKKAMDKLAFKLKEGRLPQNEDEVVIPSSLNSRGKIDLKVGDSISLDVGERVSNDGKKLGSRDAFLAEDDKSEDIQNTQKKTFKVVGKIERPSGYVEKMFSSVYTFVTYLDDNTIKNIGKVDVYAKFNNKGINNAIQIMADILNVDKSYIALHNSKNESEQNDYKDKKNDNQGKEPKYDYEMASRLIVLQTNPLQDQDVGKILLGVVVAFLIIILISSVFCIRNSFEISIAEKIKQYGMLKSVGATKKQIRNNVLLEGATLGLYGIPIGILLGNGACVILVWLCNVLLFGKGADDDFRLYFSTSWIAIVVEIVIGMAIIYLSAYKSARKATKISPIESIRNSSNIKIDAKKIKNSKLVDKFFGIGGIIAHKNIKRNKKKLRTTIVAIVISTATFISVSYGIGFIKNSLNDEFNTQDYNVELNFYNGLGSDSLKNTVLSTVKSENVDNYSITREQYIEVNNVKYSNEYKKKTNKKEERDEINIMSVGDEQFKKYLKQLNLDYDEYKDKAVFVQGIGEAGYSFEEDIEGIKKYAFNKGDTLDISTIETMESKQLKTGTTKGKIQIGCVTEKKVFSGRNNQIIVSDEVFEHYFPDSAESSQVIICYMSSNPDKLQQEIEQALKGEEYDLKNYVEEQKNFDRIMLLISIFLYGFVGMVSLIGITNIFNTITNTMSLRRKEFAMLKSIGMTKREFSRMIRLESIFMCVKSLLYGTAIGLVGAFGLNKILKGSFKTSGEFILPVFSIAICVVVVLLLIIVLMKYSIGKINKDNIIETIKNENI